jgi:hypothetical protein
LREKLGGGNQRLHLTICYRKIAQRLRHLRHSRTLEWTFAQAKWGSILRKRMIANNSLMPRTGAQDSGRHRQ